MGLNTTPATWAASEVPTSTKMNTEIRDAFVGLQEAWDSYTPVWTGTTTNPVIGNGTIVGSYMQVGKTVHVRVTITMGSTTTYGSGTYEVTLPVNAAGTGIQLLQCELGDAGVIYTAKARVSSAAPTKVLLFTLPTTAGNQDRAVTATVPFTFANTDTIRFNGTYEAA